MISIIYEKEDKKLAIRISQSLENKGFKCTLDKLSSLEVQNPKNIGDIELAILIFSQKSNHSESIMSEYDFIFDNDITFVPFVITDVELSVTMQHFLNSHDWINAFDVNSSDAINDLGILVNELINGENASPPPTKQKTEKFKSKTEKTGNKNQTYAIIAVSAIFLVILAYFIFGGKGNNSLSGNDTPDNIIVGTWKLAEYQDNLPRNPNEYADFINSISVLKQNFALTLNADNTFEKLGFAQPEYGNWQLDPQNMVLYMWPPDSDGVKDKLKIETLSNDSLVMAIATQIDSVNQIITRFSLYKE
ncbi:MAG: toll/interleukin-1 receptor domain-containing protein [Bacteroidales bacterium]|nr:toll/interleukin-1 receptor domain-containing protein [Bacteroidales bacterium]